MTNVPPVQTLNFVRNPSIPLSARTQEPYTIPFVVSGGSSQIYERATPQPPSNRFGRTWHRIQDSSTNLQELPHQLTTEVRAVFAAARHEIFEDGMESEFSTRLTVLIQQYHAAAIEALTPFIFNADANREVASETLRWVGRVDDPISYHKRLFLLERSLKSPSAVVRDGAIIGLGTMDDAHAVHYIKLAITEEKIGVLRRDMQQLLSQLEAAME